MAEKVLYQAIIDFLKLHNFFVWRASVGARGHYHFGIEGQADITGISPDGQRVEIEVKSTHGKLSKKQKEYLNEIEKRNGFVMVVNSWTDFVQQFYQKWKGIKYEKQK
jgi:hypothetical protein